MTISLASIARGVRVQPPKVILYGVGGIGKTTWAAGAPNPIFLFTEEGQGLLDVRRFELTEGDALVKSWAELIGCLKFLHEEPDHGAETVVIDSLDFAEALLWEETCRLHGEDNIEAFGYGKGYVHAVDVARGLTGWLDALRRDRGMAVVLIAHAKTTKFESPTSESYDRWHLRLQDRLAGYLHDWADAVLFADYRTHVVKDVEGPKNAKNKRERTRGVGTGERVVYTEQRPGWMAKNRYGLPPEIDLDWQSFVGGMALAPEVANTKSKKPEAAGAH